MQAKKSEIMSTHDFVLPPCNPANNFLVSPVNKMIEHIFKLFILKCQISNIYFCLHLMLWKKKIHFTHSHIAMNVLAKWSKLFFDKQQRIMYLQKCLFQMTHSYLFCLNEMLFSLIKFCVFFGEAKKFFMSHENHTAYTIYFMLCHKPL
jgi:hypothetical protein